MIDWAVLRNRTIDYKTMIILHDNANDHNYEDDDDDDYMHINLLVFKHQDYDNCTKTTTYAQDIVLPYLTEQVLNYPT